jgi:anti-sigma B factor antagonist
MTAASAPAGLRSAQAPEYDASAQRRRQQVAGVWSSTMEMQLGDAGEGVLSVSLVGRLDTHGVDHIETKLTAHLVPIGARAIVDLSQVSFLSSGGIRMFITIARALDRRGGKLVLYGAQPIVAQVLDITSLNNIVPVRVDADNATVTARG